MKRIPRARLHRVFCIISKKRTMEVSLAFLNERAMRALNKTWRGKDTQTNVLAFRFDKSAGEIIINPHQAEREARSAGISYTERVVYLFLHGLLHLYGYDHETVQDARKMEKREEKIMNHDS